MTKQKVELNYLRIAPRKVRTVADMIRGLAVNEAEAQLMHAKQRASAPLLKLLRSAVQSAEKIKKMRPDKLFIESIRVDQGPMLHRMLPRARGMATPLQKKMSHVILVLSEKETLPKPRFKIITQKKVKPSQEEKKKSKQREKKKSEKIAEKKVADSKPGFLKRMFRRKAGM